MIHKKQLSIALVLAMLSMLLTGCIYVKSDSVIHDDGSGTVYMAYGILAEEGEEPEEGQEVFEANGNKYYGSSETMTFSTVEEFNKIFTESEEENSTGTDAGTGAASLTKNSDGSLTLVFDTSSSEDEESEETPELSSEELEALENIELSPEDEAALNELGDEFENMDMEELMKKAYSVYTFTFDRPARQISGPISAVTISGNTVTIDLLQQGEDESDSIYAFTTDVPFKAVPTSQKLKVNGEAKETEIYNINGANFFKLRDIAALLKETDAKFSVDFDAAKNCIVVKKGDKYVPNGGELILPKEAELNEKVATAVKSTQGLIVDGEPAFIAPYNIGGNNFFSLRDLANVLGFEVGYDAATQTMLVNTR